MNVDQTESGKAVIRAALYARRSQLAGIARDIGVATETAHLFLSGAGLAVPALEALTKRIWGGALEYDAATDKLRSANKAKPTPVNIDCRARLVLGNPPLGRGTLGRLVRGVAPPQPKKPAWMSWIK